MSLFNTRTLQIKRNIGAWVNGYWEESEISTFDILGTWQPVTGKELEVYQDGDRSLDVFTGYTYTEIFIDDQINNIVSDIIVVDGDQYEIIKLLKWQNNIINHYKFVVTRVLE